MAFSDIDKWGAQQWITNIATLGGAELPMGDMMNLRGVDESANMGELSDASSPVYRGSPNAWMFAGGEEGDPYGYNLGSDYYRNLYNQGAGDAAGRLPPSVLAAQMNMEQQEQFRQNQLQTMARLQQQAAGAGPTTVAEQAALDQGEAAKRLATAQALSARGVSGSAALRQAQETQARAGIGAQQQQALIRAQETQGAQQALAALSGQLRGQDIGAAAQQAGYEQQANLANQQAGLRQGAMNDQLVQFYTNMGMSLDQAQMQADMAYQQMLSDIVQSQYRAQSGIVSSEMQSRSREQAGEAAAFGTIASGVGQAFGGG